MITGMFPVKMFPLPFRFMRLALFITLAIFSTTPASFAQEDATMPDEAHLEHIAEAGRLAGEIQACELDWEEFYFAYMQSERRRAANEGRDELSLEYQQRIAFIGMFFGAVQGQALEEFEDQPCPTSSIPALADKVGVVMRAAWEREGEPGAN